MRRQQGSEGRDHVENDFVEADLDAAFALLYTAESQYLPHDHAGALRALQEAQNAILDGNQRLPALSDADRERLRSQMLGMQHVIERIRSQVK